MDILSFYMIWESHANESCWLRVTEVGESLPLCFSFVLVKVRRQAAFSIVNAACTAHRDPFAKNIIDCDHIESASPVAG